MSATRSSGFCEQTTLVTSILTAVWRIAAPGALFGAQLILDDIFGWYRWVPVETWGGRILILGVAKSGVLLLWKGFRSHPPVPRRYWLSGSVLLLSAAVLANIEVRRDTPCIHPGTQLQIHVRNHNLRLL